MDARLTGQTAQRRQENIMIEITRGKYIGIGWLPHPGERFRWQVYVPINTPGHPDGAIVAGGTYGTEIDGDEPEVRARLESELARLP